MGGIRLHTGPGWSPVAGRPTPSEAHAATTQERGAQIPKLEKRLGLFDVYALATGATLSAGFFLLPGLAAIDVGPTLVAAYVLAAIPLVPAIVSKVELMTAMPRAGGIYYFLDRSLGPAAGTVGGLGIWLTLSLKVAFALVGMGAYLELFLPGMEIVPVAVILAVAAAVLNLTGAKLTGTVQIALLIGMLAILALFIGVGGTRIEPAHFQGFLDAGPRSLLATTGLVYVSYAGLTKIAGIAEEVENPERNLTLGVFLALATALVIYGVGTAVIVGVVPMEELRGDLTSVATAGEAIFGPAGLFLMSGAAFLAFAAVTNAGTMSASRYPLAMSRDGILPPFLEKLNRKGLPVAAIVVTTGVMIAVIVFLDPLKIAKLASAFKLLVFSLVCLTVIVMRESGIEEYDPGYLSPAYPWLQILGILAPLVLIGVMGWLPILFTAGLIGGGALWYRVYVRDDVTRAGALYHVFERLGRERHEGLEHELREILKEKGLREADPYAEMVSRAAVLDLPPSTAFEEAVRLGSERLSTVVPREADELAATFLETTDLGMIPISHGAALPHVRLPEIDASHLLLVRSKNGIRLPDEGAEAAPGVTDRSEADDGSRLHALFFLVSPEGDARRHLRMLASLADRIEEEGFLEGWRSADKEELKEILMEEERFVSLELAEAGPTSELIGRRLEETPLGAHTLVTLVRRNGEVLEPDPGTELRAGDRLTVLGEPEAIRGLRERFSRA